MTATVAGRLAEVRERIERAARRAARDPAAVRLVAVTKGVDVESIRAAVDAGERDLGENRAQELVAHARALGPTGEPGALRWHFVGRLQRNKVKQLAPLVTCWQSVDRPELGPVIARHAPGARVLVQVDLAGESQKGGIEPGGIEALVARLRADGLDVTGLMTVPPAHGDPRPHFATLRDLAARLGLAELSMGMSGDYEIAVEEGATMVRVGTALFGPRRGPDPRDP